MNKTFFSVAPLLLGCLLALSACNSQEIILGDSNKSGGDGGFVFGGSSSSSSSSVDNSESEAGLSSSSSSASTETSAATTTRSCGRLINSSPRGLACIHCTQTEARSQAQAIRDIMLSSCLKNLVTNYLVDGTFEFDPEFLMDEINILSSGGRRLSVIFYLGNGPAQRAGHSISPSSYRRRILTDAALQSDYQEKVVRMIPVIRFAISQGVEVKLIPFLEDNLHDEAFAKLVDLTEQAIPRNLRVEIGRNACGSACYEGNESGVPFGVFEEIHTAGPPISISGGVVSNDGRDYYSPAAGADEDANFTLNQMEFLRDASASSGNSFILWSARRQGLASNFGQVGLPRPSTRNYDFPTTAERAELIGFLRARSR